MPPKSFVSSAGVSSAKEPRLLSPKKLSATLIAVAEWLSLAAVVLVPLTFFANTSQSLEFPKQLVLLALASLAVLCWLGSMFVNRALSLRRTVANPAVLILLTAVFISALLSGAKFASIVGEGGQEYQSLMTTALFAIFFFVVINLPEKRRFTSRTIFSLVVVGGLASLYAIFQYAGVHLIPAVSSPSFNLIGSTVALGLFAAVTMVMAATSFLTEVTGKMALAKRIIAGFFGVCALVLTIIIDFWPIWVAVIVGLLAILVFAIVRPQAIRRLSWLTVPMIVLVIATLFLAVNIPSPIHAPAEVFPSFTQSFSVARDSLYSHPIFGSGPGTFAQDFALHRGLDLNKSPLWYVQFDRGESYLSTIAATLGLAGLVAWLAVIVIGVWKSVAYLIASRKKDDAGWLIALAVSAAWLTSAVGLLLYGASFASLFLFWVLFALLTRATSANRVDVGFESSPRASLVMTLVFVITIVLSLAGWFISGTRLYADVAFASGVNKNTETQVDAVITDLESAAKMNPQSDSIQRNLSQAYLIKIRQLFGDKSLDATARGTQVQALTSAAVKAGQQATVLYAGNAQNWSQLGAVYEAITSYVTNAPDQAIEAYNKAAELDPTSPAHPTSLGRINLAMASIGMNDLKNVKDEAAKATVQKKINDALASAVTNLQNALKLKSDYAPASYQIALAYDSQGKIKEAIASLQGTLKANPVDAGVAFEMASLYYRDGQKDMAQTVLENLIKQAPDFANGRWLLATLYQEKKMYAEAISQVEEIAKTNAGNADVQTFLQTLKDERDGKAPATKPNVSPNLP